MGILSDMDLENLPEMTAVPVGEYEMRIVSAEDYTGKQSGKQSIRVVLDIPSELSADAIYHYIALPSAEDDEKTNIRKRQRIKQFLQAFNISKDMEYGEWVGHTAWGLVGQEADQNGEPRNTVKRFLGQATGSSAEGATSGSEGQSFDDIPF